MVIKSTKVTVQPSAPGVFPSASIVDVDVTTDGVATATPAELEATTDTRTQMDFYCVVAAGSVTVKGELPELKDATDVFVIYDTDGTGAAAPPNGEFSTFSQTRDNASGAGATPTNVITVTSPESRTTDQHVLIEAFYSGGRSAAGGDPTAQLYDGTTNIGVSKNHNLSPIGTLSFAFEDVLTGPAGTQKTYSLRATSASGSFTILDAFMKVTLLNT